MSSSDLSNEITYSNHILCCWPETIARSRKLSTKNLNFVDFVKRLWRQFETETDQVQTHFRLALQLNWLVIGPISKSISVSFVGCCHSTWISRVKTVETLQSSIGGNEQNNFPWNESEMKIRKTLIFISIWSWWVDRLKQWFGNYLDNNLRKHQNLSGFHCFKSNERKFIIYCVPIDRQ